MQNNKNSDLELISALEEIKSTYKKSFPFIFVFLVILIGCVAFAASGKATSGASAYLSLCVLACISVIGLIAIFCIRLSAVKKMKEFFAEKLIKDYLDKIFDSFVYQHHSRLSDHILRQQMYLSKRIDKIKGSDYIRGVYKGLELEMSDISLIQVTETRDSKGNRRRHEEEFFKGIWCVCNLKKTLESDLWITEKTSFFDLNFFTVKTDSEAFNKRFAVRTETPVEAFYVLTPHMMEYIESMDKKAQGSTHLCFLRDGKLYIAINSRRDSFEFGFNCDIAKARQVIESDLSYITNFIDELIASSYYRK